MSIAFPTVKRRVWVGLVAGLVGVMSWTWWVRGQQKLAQPPPKNTQPFVQLAGASATAANRILQERAELFDPTPLFFPTNWNYGQRPLNAERLRQPGQVFGTYEAKFTVNEQSLALFGSEKLQVPQGPTDLLAQGNEVPFAGFGQMDKKSATLPVRAGYLEVRRLGSKEIIKEQSLSGVEFSRVDFAPVEFLVVIGAGGLIGEPILISGSGWDEVDNLLRNYLVTSYRLGDRFSPGRYRVLVGT